MNSYHNIYDSLDSPVWIQDSKNRIIYVNNSFIKTFNVEIDLNSFNYEYLNSNNSDLYQFMSAITVLNPSDNIEYNEKLFKYIVVNHDFNLNEKVAMLVDVSDVRETYKSNLDKSILKTVIDNIPYLIFYKDKNLRYAGMNKECEEFYRDRGVNEIIGKTDLELPLDEFFIEECTRNDKKIFKTKETMYIDEEVPLVKKSGYGIMHTIKTPLIGKDGSVEGLVGIVSDITEQRNLENRLRELSYTDNLTGAYNRTFFEEKIEEISKNNSYPIGIISGDVDGLKYVNDNLGHLEGDCLIKQISDILVNTCKDEGFVIRWGGDEFITILPNSSPKECKEYINEVNILCKKTRSNPYRLSISQGYTIMPEEMLLDEALRISDDNMYIEKKRKKRR